MHKEEEKHPFVFKYSDENNAQEYLGSDGLPIADTYKLYLQKCEEFKTKARQYARDNLNLKNSYIHHTKYGYKSCEQLEEEVLLERSENLKQYRQAFNITLFDEDPNSMYECMTGKSKRIRIIRELNEERNEKLTEDFDKKKGSWFVRYCILSRFIEAARKIILLNRLKKVLAILKIQMPEIIKNTELNHGKQKKTAESADEYQENYELKKTCCGCSTIPLGTENKTSVSNIL